MPTDITLTTVQKRMLREFAFRPLDALHFCSSTRAVSMAPKSVQLHINVMARAGLVEEISGRHFQITHTGRNLLDNWTNASAQSNSRYEAARNTVKSVFTGIEMVCTRPGAGKPSLNGRAA